jgi:hypothetical protein
MRTITNESVNAFINGRSFKKANMKVVINEVTKNVALYLHNNMIALLSGNELMINHQGWQTNTTKERLNGVLDAFNLPRLSQKKGVWYIGAEEFTGVKNFNI